MTKYDLPDSINGFKILKDLGRKGFYTRMALVICKECKREYRTAVYYLKTRKHCGCLFPPVLKCSYRKSHPRLLQIYKCMRARCYYKKDKNYHLYGGKNIKICQEWLDSPDAFCEWALINGYSDNLSIDRINNDENYRPDNCRWSDTKTQARNRKGIKLTPEKANAIRAEYVDIPKKELAKKYNIAIGTVNHVLSKTRWAE